MVWPGSDLLHRTWEFGNGGQVAALIAMAPQPPNFPACGEPRRPDAMVLSRGLSTLALSIAMSLSSYSIQGL